MKGYFSNSMFMKHFSSQMFALLMILGLGSFAHAESTTVCLIRLEAPCKTAPAIPFRTWFQDDDATANRDAGRCIARAIAYRLYCQIPETISPTMSAFLVNGETTNAVVRYGTKAETLSQHYGYRWSPLPK